MLKRWPRVDLVVSDTIRGTWWETGRGKMGYSDAVKTSDISDEPHPAPWLLGKRRHAAEPSFLRPFVSSFENKMIVV